MQMHQTISPNIAKQHLGFDPEKPLVFILGGSQGAESINRHIEEHIDWYTTHEKFSLLWQCGERNLEKYIDYVTTDGSIQVKGFIYEMGMAYSASDIIIARAGALTISELAIIGKPAILIPLPTAAANHQYHNAMGYASNGAAIVVEQDELKNGLLEQSLTALLETEAKRERMSGKALEHAKPEATQQIVESIYELAGYGIDV
ncbi:MAG: UDP-N-acetylglucosamine--N-acetylmuramyl-(pentapeptide) pyrophosphoryl-undecaprenol N-acetylglucosamine transferase [Candidatus Marinimicrobia bacterium]|nr:UDP-N-acetylglucosamine--N-acetylmuramyl-(pentapeptide) pyrophosphoryl-undecaprenol N-acetylglucosamine transferase [Candidatus Neomarinimicrobiota bacterium]